MRSRALTLAAQFALATVLGLGLLAVSRPAVAAPSSPAGEAPVTTLGEQPEGGGIIPRPDTGVEPEDAGDRGGALQTVVFVVILAGIGLIGYLVVRESRKKRAERGF